MKYFIWLLAYVTFFGAAKTAGQNSSEQVNAWLWQQVNSYKIHSFIPHKKIKVAIIDGAFDTEHPLLKPWLAANPKEIAENDIDDDKNGFTDDVSGWDFADADADLQPSANNYSSCLHSNRVADVFTQVIERLVPDAQKWISILPLKTISDRSNNNYITAGYQAIAYAIDQHADMIICSWAGTVFSEEQKKILQRAANAGIVIVGSAGNYYFKQPQFPGAFNRAICVTAVSRDGSRYPIANFGGFVDIAAPGDSIASIQNHSVSRSGSFSATSAAAPVVAGVVAALKASGYKGGPADIDRLLKNSATPIDHLNNLYAGKMGAGLLNVDGLFALLQNGKLELLRQQPQGYIDVGKLQETTPVKWLASARFKDLKLNFSGLVAPATVRLQRFYGGNASTQTVTVSATHSPITLVADSVYFFGKASPAQKGFIYYEAETIDSSNFYCSGTISVKGTEGFVEDGSGNDNYTGGNDCKWLIEVPAGKRIAIDFAEFDTEPKKDQVYIFNGDLTNAPILAIFSGPNIPPKIESGGNLVLVWFITTETLHGKGWKLHYKAID